MARIGRPRIDIDKKLFENLCAIQCTLEEVSGVLDCSADTVERWCKRTYNSTFADIYKKCSAKGKVSLRRMQFKLAEKSAPMAIFLGKNLLGQSDKDDYDKQLAAAKTEALRTVQMNGNIDTGTRQQLEDLINSIEPAEGEDDTAPKDT